MGSVTHGRESHLTTTILVLLALSLGVCAGIILCSVMMVASEEQRRAERLLMSEASALEPESLP